MPRGRDLVPNLLAANLGTKLLAVLLAYGVWLAVIEEKQGLRQLDVPVRFENIDPAVAMSGERLSTIQVRVHGAEGAIKDLQPPDIEVVVDLARLGIGTHNITLRPDSPSILPRRPGLQVVEVSPALLRVKLERKLEASIPVRPVLAGKPAEGHEVRDVTVSPPTILISGPESAVLATTSALTRPVGIEGRREDYQQDVWVDIESPDVTVKEPVRARVAVQITERSAERSFADQPIAVLNTSWESQVRPAQITITARGPERLVANLTAADLVASVDATGLAPRSEAYELRVRVRVAREQLKRLDVRSVEERVSVRVLDRKAR